LPKNSMLFYLRSFNSGGFHENSFLGVSVDNIVNAELGEAA
jgi:hypothetical protein